MLRVREITLEEKEIKSEKEKAPIKPGDLENHYRDKYYKAIIIMDKKHGIESVLSENGACSNLGLISRSAVYDLEIIDSVKSQFRSRIEPVTIQRTRSQRETIIYRPTIQSGESVRSRTQTRMWVGV